MLVLVSWLEEMLGALPEPEELARILTERGLEVEETRRLGAGLAGARVARAVEVRPLTAHLYRVVLEDGGAAGAVVVTGADNVRPGCRVPYAPPGCRLPDGRELGVANFHGEESAGMLLSADEIGIGPDHEGILLLDDAAPVGADVAAYLGLPETVFDVALTPSFSQHCHSMLGVAREVAAALGRALPEGPAPWPAPDSPAAFDVQAVGEICPLYLGARLVRRSERPSPLWLQRRLFAAGMRPLLPVVDVTNYVMLELGQPLHPFGFDGLEGGVRVREAREGEVIRTLDGVDRSLVPSDIVIADERGPVALAGVMGSERAEVSSATDEVFLEAALFRAPSVAATMRRHGLRSEAAQRFAHGLPGDLPARALRRMAELLPEVGWEMTWHLAVGEAPAPPRPIAVDPAYVRGLLGLPLAAEEQASDLERLGFAVSGGEAGLSVTPPSWRIDVSAPCDVAEEVLRSAGIDRLGEELPPQAPRAPEPEPPLYALRREALVCCAALGYRTAVSYSLVDPVELERLGRRAELEVANPLSADMRGLRTTLWLGLLHAVRRNRARGVQDIALAEAGRVFRMIDGRPAEADVLALALVGDRPPLSRFGRHAADFFALKGDVEAALGMLRIGRLEFRPANDAALHPGRQAEVLADGLTLGTLGELHPALALEFGIDAPVELCEISLGQLGLLRGPVRAVPIPRYPALIRDLAVTIDQAVNYGRLRQVLHAALGELLAQDTLFDVFTGPPVPIGRKSVALRLTLQSPERTLTEADAEEAIGRALRAMGEQLGAERR